MSDALPEIDDSPRDRSTVARLLKTALVLQALLIAGQLVPLNILAFFVNTRLAEAIAGKPYSPALVVVDVLFGTRDKNLWTLAAIAWFYAAVASVPLTFLWCRLRPSRNW